jgi:hypothetical protein
MKDSLLEIKNMGMEHIPIRMVPSMKANILEVKSKAMENIIISLTSFAMRDSGQMEFQPMSSISKFSKK